MSTQQEARNKWIAALRSGKYIQTKGYLHNRQGYCCLGVACDLFAEELGLTRSHGTLSNEIELFNLYPTILPEPVQELLGLYGNNGQNKTKSRICLSNLNDSGRSFNEIANELETGNYWK